MAEAKPFQKGHAYGRRTGNLSNTSEPGELCIYIGHGITKFSDSSYRYDSHQACTRCVAAAPRGTNLFRSQPHAQEGEETCPEILVTG